MGFKGGSPLSGTTLRDESLSFDDEPVWRERRPSCGFQPAESFRLGDAGVFLVKRVVE